LDCFNPGFLLCYFSFTRKKSNDFLDFLRYIYVHPEMIANLTM
jgi:hypothetical protein